MSKTQEPTVTHTPTPWHLLAGLAERHEKVAAQLEADGCGYQAETRMVGKVLRSHPTLVELLEDAGNALAAQDRANSASMIKGGDFDEWQRLEDEASALRSRTITRIDAALKELRNE